MAVRRIRLPNGEEILVDAPPSKTDGEVYNRLHDKGNVADPNLYARKIKTEERTPDLPVLASIVARPFGIAREEFLEGTGEIKNLFTGPDAFSGKAFLKASLGTLQAAFAPVTGLVRGAIAEPVGNYMRRHGYSEETAGWVETGLEVAGMLAIPGRPILQAINLLRKAGHSEAAVAAMKATQGVETNAVNAGMSYAAEVARTKGKNAKDMMEIMDEQFKRVLPAGTREEIDLWIKTKRAGEEGAMELKLPDKIYDEMAVVANSIMTGRGLKEGERAFQRIAELIGDKSLTTKEIEAVMNKFNMSAEQFSALFLLDVSRSGRILRKQRTINENLRKLSDKDPWMRELTDAIGAEQTGMEAFWGFYGRVESYRRGLLVTQAATAVRNAVTGMGAYTLSAFEGVMSNIFTGTGLALTGRFTDGMHHMTAGINAFFKTHAKLPGSKRKWIDELFENGEWLGDTFKMKLMTPTVSEAVLGKAANFLNGLNRVQEGVIRRTAFEFKMRELLGRKGKTLEGMMQEARVFEGANGYSKVLKDLQGDFEHAIDFALTNTFAATPKSSAGKQVVDAFRKIPGLTLAVPFPRFLFGNAIPFMVYHSPLGMMRLMTKDRAATMAKLVGGALGRDVRMSGKELDQLTRIATETGSGMLMFEGAYRWTQNSLASSPESKWYEWKLGDKYVDIRPYAPFSAFALASTAMLAPERLTLADFVETSVGLRRISGTPLALVDMMRAKDPMVSSKQLYQLMGQYVGSFAVPMRTVKDIVDGFAPEDAVLRDVKQSPILGPLIDNIPGLDKLNNKKYVPTRAGELNRQESRWKFTMFGNEIEVPATIVRQFTGMSAKNKNALESELSRLQMEGPGLFPKTGDPMANNIIAYWQGYFMDRVSGPFVNSPGYKHMNDGTKKLVLSKFFESSKQYGTAMLQQFHPLLWADIKAKGYDKNLAEAIGFNPYLQYRENLVAAGYQDRTDIEGLAAEAGFEVKPAARGGFSLTPLRKKMEAARQ